LGRRIKNFFACCCYFYNSFIAKLTQPRPNIIKISPPSPLLLTLFFPLSPFSSCASHSLRLVCWPLLPSPRLFPLILSMKMPPSLPPPNILPPLPSTHLPRLILPLPPSTLPLQQRQLLQLLLTLLLLSEEKFLSPVKKTSVCSCLPNPVT